MQDSVKQDRQNWLGGSDIPVIMNLSPYKSRWQLLREKAGLEEDTFEGDVYTEYGNVMEEKIRDHINNSNMVYGEEPFHEDKFIREAEGNEPIGIRCHCDGINSSTILEVKTTGEKGIHENVDDYLFYLVQVLYYCVNFEKRYAMLAVYERPGDFSTEFDVRRLHVYPGIDTYQYRELIFDIGKAVFDFMVDLKRLKENPFLEEQDFMPKELVSISDKILALESQIADMKKIEDEIKSFKAQLVEEMTKHKVKTWRTPNKTIITLVEKIPDKVEVEDELDLKSLKRDLPDLWKSESDGGYLKSVEKIKKGKAAYIKITLPKEK